MVLSLTFNKGLGQNFLVNPTVCPRMADAVRESTDGKIGVLEIGAGVGVLTKELLERCEKVVCVELDTRLFPVLDDTLSGYDNLTLINEDILKADLDTIIKEHFDGMEIFVCANLPYYITTPIIMKLLEDKLALESITVMVQKEVAERLADKPGGKEVGAITYSINYYTNPEIIIDVPRDSFIPAPNVDLAVIKLDVLKEPKVNVLDEQLFFKVIKFSFLQKRKTLINSLSNSGLLPKDFLEEMLNSLGIDLKVRAEQLTLENFAQIADYIKNNI
mgnify:CR=1 FL=1